MGGWVGEMGVMVEGRVGWVCALEQARLRERRAGGRAQNNFARKGPRAKRAKTDLRLTARALSVCLCLCLSQLGAPTVRGRGM